MLLGVQTQGLAFFTGEFPLIPNERVRNIFASLLTCCHSRKWCRIASTQFKYNHVSLTVLHVGRANSSVVMRKAPARLMKNALLIHQTK